jgi:hypothetical protein
VPAWSFAAFEIARLLRAGAWFIAQTVGDDNYPELNRRLEGPATRWRAEGDASPPSFEDAGLEVVERREAKPAAVFRDIGAVTYYLNAVPWQISGFSVAAYRNRLRRLHSEILRDGGVQTHYHRHFVVARKHARNGEGAADEAVG